MSLSHHRPARRPRPGAPRRDHGYVLAKFAILLVPLLLMTGLSVDVGYWYNRAADIQKAADAAALAGVVWLPDLATAKDNARVAAAKNGFVDGVDGITLTIEPAGDRRLRVSIRDESVGSFFFLSLGGREIDMTREGLAEYVLPVPLGSPYNFFGMGGLTSSTPGSPLASPTVIYQSVNPSCTSKVNGDRHQSLHFSTTTSLSSCDSVPSNDDYRTQGYELYVEAKAGRTDNIDVELYDPRYSEAVATYQVPDGEDCVTTPIYSPSSTTWTTGTASTAAILAGPAQYQTRTSTTGSFSTTTNTINWGQSTSVTDSRLIRYRVAATWTPGAITWTTSSSSSNVTVTGPAVYQTRTSTSNSYSTTAVTYLAEGATVTRAANLIQYRRAVLNSNTTCTPLFKTVNEPFIDSKRQSINESFNFSLYAADATPLTDTDNPLVTGCSKSYASGTAFDNPSTPYLGSVRWNKLCTITPTMPSGRYVLRVHNGTGGLGADGSNQWGLVAKYANATGDGLCDGRANAMCPRVYGKDAISVYANTASATAAFFLAEIDGEHNGKTLELELWDPGEGGSKLEILRPNGAGWSVSNFSWTSFDDNGVQTENSGTVASVDIANPANRFNGELLRIRIPLTNYTPLATNKWWKIQYTFATSVTDRTTWSAKVVGDPVHLLEEEAG
ncbi:MAG TPA: pilus assembly protein TadG-related protein [Iamia sp.]|jgi:hypothetical protein|nr:pilus assembly protein TadG-related protein [Iamia sp.]